MLWEVKRQEYRETLASHDGDEDWVLQDLSTPRKRWRESGNAFLSIRRLFEEAGLYRPRRLTHEIRRAVASTMLLDETPIHVVREGLGHSHIATTELFAVTHEEAKRAAAKNALA